MRIKNYKYFFNIFFCLYLLFVLGLVFLNAYLSQYLMNVSFFYALLIALIEFVCAILGLLGLLKIDQVIFKRFLVNNGPFKNPMPGKLDSCNGIHNKEIIEGLLNSPTLNYNFFYSWTDDDLLIAFYKEYAYLYLILIKPDLDNKKLILKSISHNAWLFFGDALLVRFIDNRHYFWIEHWNSYYKDIKTYFSNQLVYAFFVKLKKNDFLDETYFQNILFKNYGTKMCINNVSSLGPGYLELIRDYANLKIEDFLVHDIANNYKIDAAKLKANITPEIIESVKKDLNASFSDEAFIAGDISDTMLNMLYKSFFDVLFLKYDSLFIFE